MNKIGEVKAFLRWDKNLRDVKKMQLKNIFAIFLVAFFLRLFYVMILTQEEILVGDAVQYDTIAWNFANGRGFSLNPNVPTTRRAPGYPFFLAFIYFFFGHNYVIVRIFQAILSALTCIFLYFIAKEFFDKKIAKVSAWLLALYPVLIVYCGLLLSETLFTFLLAVAISFLIKGISTVRNKYFVGGGVFLGLATLTRPVTLLFPFVLLVFFIIAKRKLILNWIVFFLIFVFILSPWVIRNYTLFGIYNLCSTGIGYGVFVTGNTASGYTFEESYQKFAEIAKRFPEPQVFIPKQNPDIEREKILLSEGMKLIKANLKNYFIIVVKRLPRFWWTSHSSVFGVDRPIPEYIQQKNYLHLSIRLGLLGLHGVFLILAFVGIILSIKNWQNTLILIFVLIYFTGHILFDIVPRYHIPAIPYLFIFTSIGTCFFYRVFKKTK